MVIENLKIERLNNEDKKLAKAAQKMQNLIGALNKKETPDEVASTINEDVRLLNSFSGTDKECRKAIRKTRYKILKLIEKKLKWVPKNHYRNTWLALGIAFGVAFGTAFSAEGNSSNIAIGIPIGMVIGMAFGAGMDKKAEKEGKQLDFEA